MDLFEKEEKGKEILDGGKRVILTLKSNGKYTVEVTSGAIKVTQKGALNVLNKGLVGTKTFSINRLSGVQLKDPGMTTGYLQFILMGSSEGKGGVFNAVQDENTITFSKKEKNLIHELKDFIDYAIENPNNREKDAPDLDDLRKLKSLLDDGIITAKEFEAKKIKLLDL
jgi:hypothetical protein